MKKGAILIAIAAFVALVYYCISYVRAPVSTMSAYSMTHEEVVVADAYIVRDETVYPAPASGTFYSSAVEGVRVGRNRRISTVYGADVSEEVLSELSNIDAKIETLTSTVVDGSEFMAGGSSVEEKLIQLTDNIEEAAYNNDIEKIGEYKKEINALLSGELGTVTVDELALLKEQRAQLEREITGSKHDIYSNVAGIYSCKVDGYEDVLTPESINGLNCAGFSKIEPEEVKVQLTEEEMKEDKEGSLYVNAGDKVCKIMDNHRWYIVALANKDDVNDLKIGQKISIRFSKLPGEETVAVVKSVSSEAPEQKKTVVVLECDSYSEGAFSIRAGEVEIVKKSYNGFAVPVNAIRVIDAQKGVMVRRGGSDVFKPCKILYTDESKGQAIVVPDTDDMNKTLQLYDIVIVGEK